MQEPYVALTFYCERADATFWAEPVNALTNLAFVLAAAAVFTALVRNGGAIRKLWDLWLMGGLIGAIGIGSFLWHTLATPWSAVADVLPILLFINLFLASFLIRISRFKAAGVIGAIAVFQVINIGVLQWLSPDTLNGSVFYVPTWATLWILVAYSRRNGFAGRQPMFIAGLVFTLSLTLRTLDVALCPSWPLGTHFAWHLLNGMTLYLVMMGLLMTVRQAGLQKTG